MKKKKIFGKIFIFTILITMCISYPSNIMAEEIESNEPQKGELRCPTSPLGKDVTCKETRDEVTGEVTEVRITYGKFDNPGDIQIVKVVQKTEVLGRVGVHFEVRGKDIEQSKIPEPVYITMIIDMSKTISGRQSQAKSAAKAFAKTLIPESQNGTSNYYLSLMQFASNNLVKREFDNSNFDNVSFSNYNKNGLGKKSHLEKALKAAKTRFDQVTGKKYVFLFGDGRYYSDEDTGVSATIKNANALRASGVNFYIVRYPGTHTGSKFEWKSQANHVRCYKQSYGTCDYKNMIKIMCGDVYKNGDTCSGGKCNNNCSPSVAPSTYYYAPKASEYETLFTSIAEKIAEESNNGQRVTISELTDKIGENFTIVDDTSRIKKFNVGIITENGYVSDTFLLDINEYAPTGWNDINDGFQLSYNNVNGEKVTLNCNDNPELYWIRANLEVNACTGTTSANNQNVFGDEMGYYKIICDDDYTVTFQVDNITNVEQKTFSAGFMGFPVNIKIKSNVKCEYTFDYEKYNTDYENATKELNSEEQAAQNAETEEEKTVHEKNYAYLYKQIDTMNKILNEYTSNTDNNIGEYVERFTNQIATLSVSYNENKASDELNFINSGQVTGTPSCKTNGSTQKVNGKDVAVSKTCSAILSKTLQLPQTCLSMKDGEQEECANSDYQLSGGNTFFPNLSYSGGKVEVSLRNAGYRGHLDFKLNGDDCTFTTDNLDIMYRQIDLDDPFIKEDNPSRGVGKNYLNTKYNFENIINNDLWDENNDTPKYDFEYRYIISKENVANIRKDTSEEGSDSYLGKNCYFNSNNQYICEFTRNQSGNGNASDNNWFTIAESNKGK